MDRKFYLTTSIAYVNDEPHLGHALEAVQADALARYQRLQGKKVFFLTGTDEHGLKNFLAAKNLGISPQRLVDRNAKLFLNLKEILNLSFDDFIRTTDKKRHFPAVQKVWRLLKKAGALKKKAYRGLYCVGCEAFLTPKELVGGKCPLHRTKPEVVEEENWFFLFSHYASSVTKAIKSGKLKIIPPHRASEVLNVIKTMPEISFSRLKSKLPWGVPVPGDPNQTIYVWGDALVNYLSAIGFARNTHRKWWPADLHIVGKDILKFHAAIWPAILLAIGERLPQAVLVHGFVSLEGKKMSKSAGHYVTPLEVVKKYGVDALRYYLLKEIPTTGDGDFTWERFEAIYRGELANNLGNLVSRVLTLALHHLEGVVPGRAVDPFQSQVIVDTYRDFMDSFRLDRALVELDRFISRLNVFVDKEKPWLLVKTDPPRFNRVIYQLLEGVRLSALLFYPFIPQSTNLIYQALGLPEIKEEKSAHYRWGVLSRGGLVKRKIPILFPKNKYPLGYLNKIQL